MAAALAVPDAIIGRRSRLPPPLSTARGEDELLSALLPTPAPVAVPDDEIADATIKPALASRRAIEHYPVSSLITGATPSTLKEVFTQAVQARFCATLNQRDPRIVAKLNQPFGKDNLLQRFHSQAALRLVLLPLWKSGFLYGNTAAWDALCIAYYPARVLRELLQEVQDVPFHGIRGFPPDWESESVVNEGRVRMCTAALLHFNGSAADMVRWIGGPHVGAQRDHDATFALLENSGVEPEVISDLQRIFFDGIPALCKAEATEDNFLAYYLYGNHTTVDEVPEKTYKAMVKDNRKGFTLLLDPRAVLFMLDCHLTPPGHC